MRFGVGALKVDAGMLSCIRFLAGDLGIRLEVRVGGDEQAAEYLHTARDSLSVSSTVDGVRVGAGSSSAALSLAFVVPSSGVGMVVGMFRFIPRVTPNTSTIEFPVESPAVQGPAMEAQFY